MKLTEQLIANAKKAQTATDTANEKILDFSPQDELYYRAFSAPTPDPLLRLNIHTDKIHLMPRYDLLYDVAYSGIGDFVGLIFPHMRVKMFGRNLRLLVKGLFTHSVEWVREYDPNFWKFAPGDNVDMEPCIDEIIIESVSLDPEAEIKARADSQAGKD
ncbi:MAG: hypothetical protein KME46_32750 [Brasilonema angustatum HA4187-MV1]|nr:hypothetical protein [Brasilonema angustatum HA4187-MV1]